MTDTKKISRGRPQQFNRAEALENAKVLFCRYGYDKTSLSQLTKAMSIRPPSLYSAFGDKAQLFIEVLETYHKPYREKLVAIFNADEEIETALRNFIDLNKQLHTQPDPQGCLLVNSTILLASSTEAISEKIRSLHQLNEKLIAEFLYEKIRQGDLSADCDPSDVAVFINSQIQASALIARRQQSATAVEVFLETALRSILLLLNV